MRAGGHLVGRGRCLGDVAGDFRRRRALLLDRRGDRAGDRVDLGDGRLDPSHRRHRGFGRGAHLIDMARYFLRRTGSLGSECLHLGSHHGETLAGITGAGCLDRRVERQQVGFGGDRADHVGDRANLFDLLIERLHRRPGFATGDDRAANHRGGLAHLAADLSDGG
ncbi:MAG: hypothetical protein QOH05_1244 [Acetobacteraceae bacterium]|nr:hypothetical protein [Acetobacteraceae bacterium]